MASRCSTMIILIVTTLASLASLAARGEPVQITPQVCLARVSQFLASSPSASIPDQVHAFAGAFNWARIIEQEAEDSIDWSLYRRPAECDQMKAVVAEVEAKFECASELDYEEDADIQKMMLADKSLSKFWFANLACSLSDNSVRS